MVKKLLANAGDTRDVGSIPELGRKGNGNLLQHSCLESPVDRGAWRAAVRSVTKSWTHERLSVHTYTRIYRGSQAARTSQMLGPQS